MIKESKTRVGNVIYVEKLNPILKRMVKPLTNILKGIDFGITFIIFIV